MESALTTSAPRCSASATPRSDLPVAVGPTMAMTSGPTRPRLRDGGRDAVAGGLAAAVDVDADVPVGGRGVGDGDGLAVAGRLARAVVGGRRRLAAVPDVEIEVRVARQPEGAAAGTGHRHLQLGLAGRHQD